jgi:hypothetical protein
MQRHHLIGNDGKVGSGVRLEKPVLMEQLHYVAVAQSTLSSS